MNGFFLNNESSKLPRNIRAVSFVITLERKCSVILILCCIEEKNKKESILSFWHTIYDRKEINGKIESFVTFLRLL